MANCRALAGGALATKRLKLGVDGRLLVEGPVGATGSEG